jgi:AraC family transcriptional regulator
MTTPSESDYRRRILAVQLFVQQRLDEELPLERLARVAHFSPFHFHRIFRAITGEAVHEYVRRLRLERAALHLRTTDRPVTQVAFDAGYATHEAFSRAFRQQFGTAPSRYRAGRALVTRKEIGAMAEATAVERPVRVESFPPRRVAFLRHVGPYNACGPTFGRLAAWAGPRGLLGPGAMCLGVCSDDPDVTPADKCRMDCCVTVPDDFNGDGEVAAQTLPGGPHAVLTHRGPYEGLPESYRWLYGAWLPASGREPGNAPPFEVYRNNPQTTPPGELLTDICLPLAR